MEDNESAVDITSRQETDLPRRRIVWFELAAVLLLIPLPTMISEFTPPSYSPPNLVSVAYRIAAAVGRIAIILFIVWIGDGSLSTLGISKPKRWGLDLVLVGCGTLVALALEFVPPLFVSRDFMHLGHRSSAPSNLYAFYGIPIWLILLTLVFTVSLEEVVFRGYLLTRLREQFGNYWSAILVSSIVFGVGHIYQGYYGVIIATLLGVLFGFIFAISQRLWPSIVVHFALDAFLVIRYAYWLAHR